LRAAWVGLALGTAMTVACGDQATSPRPAPGARRYADGVSREDSLAWNPDRHRLQAAITGTSESAATDCATPYIVSTVPVSGHTIHTSNGTWCQPTFQATPATVIKEEQPYAITFTFSSDIVVDSVIGRHAIDCRGDPGSAAAYDGSASPRLLDSLPFFLPVPDDCGSDQVTFGANVAFQYVEHVRTVIIYPFSPFSSVEGDGEVIGHYEMEYRVFFHEPCAPVGDPVADSREARQGLMNELAASRQNADSVTGRGRVERSGYVMQRTADNSVFIAFVPPLSATDCGNTTGPVPSIAGAVPIAYWHTHPSREHEHFFTCPTAGPKDYARPLANGGGSKTDWESMLSSGYPSYVIGYPGVLSRLDSTFALPIEKRPSNTKRWTLDRANPLLCPAQGVRP
jgi:hypothetical protein